MSISSRVVLEGGKNLILQVHGCLQDEAKPWIEILDVDKLQVPNRRLRIDGASWLIQEKGTLFLWWDKDNLIFPMESRNKADFYHPLDCPKDNWSRKLYISWENCPTSKQFMFQINMDKQL